MNFQYLPERKYTMASVAPKSFYAHLYETSGVLSKVDGEFVFFGDDDTMTTVEPSMFTFLTVLGEVGLSGCQALADKRHGGFVTNACTRGQEVR
jgi:hypothetical protein